MLTLSLTCGLCFATANPHNSTAVSETYEGVHIAEANRKSAVGERKLEDMLHWAIGLHWCLAYAPIAYQTASTYSFCTWSRT